MDFEDLFRCNMSDINAARDKPYDMIIFWKSWRKMFVNTGFVVWISAFDILLIIYCLFYYIFEFAEQERQQGAKEEGTPSKASQGWIVRRQGQEAVFFGAKALLLCQE